jgi:hypothetical protein
VSLDGRSLLQNQGVDWIHLAQDRIQLRGPREHGKEPSGSVRDGGYIDQLGDC